MSQLKVDLLWEWLIKVSFVDVSAISSYKNLIYASRVFFDRRAFKLWPSAKGDWWFTNKYVLFSSFRTARFIWKTQGSVWTIRWWSTLRFPDAFRLRSSRADSCKRYARLAVRSAPSVVSLELDELLFYATMHASFQLWQRSPRTSSVIASVNWDVSVKTSCNYKFLRKIDDVLTNVCRCVN